MSKSWTTSTVIMDYQVDITDFENVMLSRIGFLYTVSVKMRLNCFCFAPEHILIYFKILCQYSSNTAVPELNISCFVPGTRINSAFPGFC